MKLNYKGYFFNLDGDKTEFTKILSKVSYVQNVIKPFQRIVINLELVSEFTAALIGISSLNKEVVILPNNQKGTLDGFRAEYDFVLSELREESPPSHIELNLDSLVTMFTSGSQGEPQKISKDLYHLIRECQELEKTFFNEVKDQVIISTVGHQHIYGILFRVLWPLLSHKPISDYSILYPEHLNKSSQLARGICLISSPAFLKRLREEDVNDLTRRKVKSIFSSGGSLDNEVAEKINSFLGTYPIEVYGSTETGGIAYRRQLDKNIKWRAFDCVEIKMDPRNCLVVTSPYIFNNSFITNDLISDVQARTFILQGRVDRVYKIEEKRLSLDEMEKKILKIDEVLEVYCMVLERKKRQVVGCVIAQKRSWKKVEKLLKIGLVKKHLLKTYEAVLVPKVFRFVDELPYNEQSKLQRDKVLRLFDERR